MNTTCITILPPNGSSNSTSYARALSSLLHHSFKIQQERERSSSKSSKRERGLIQKPARESGVVRDRERQRKMFYLQ